MHWSRAPVCLSSKDKLLPLASIGVGGLLIADSWFLGLPAACDLEAAVPTWSFEGKLGLMPADTEVKGSLVVATCLFASAELCMCDFDGMHQMTGF